ncbi:MAG: hypothetical protein CMJ29_00020 [Phycisphaerae bacterium]|nr:hypothetical protein [Phycisphaerae bacterium]|tara:strand:- start:431 stop:883 length:453 start_codon:yes stop_codon:yes gene_type:complete
MTQPASQAADSQPRSCNPTAGLLAWIFPGLGHVYLGQRHRGFLVMAGILFLFICGLLVGGLDAVDLKNDKIWFVGQAFNGPITFVANFLNQTLIQARPEALRLQLVGLGNVNALGTLFITLGGLMNLIVILDAFYPQPWDDRPARRKDDR